MCRACKTDGNQNGHVHRSHEGSPQTGNRKPPTTNRTKPTASPPPKPQTRHRIIGPGGLYYCLTHDDGGGVGNPEHLELVYVVCENWCTTPGRMHTWELTIAIPRTSCGGNFCRNALRRKFPPHSRKSAANNKTRRNQNKNAATPFAFREFPPHSRRFPPHSRRFGRKN